jgi:hypothetical protein
MIKKFLQALTYLPIYGMKPIKLFAYRTRFKTVKRFILPFTALTDFLVQWVHGQNEIMVLNQKLFGGNFIFGSGLMVTDYKTTAAEIPRPSHRKNNFMGIPIVSVNEAFVVNSPMISLGEPFRTLARNHVNETVFTPELSALDYEQVKNKCKGILSEWLEDEKASDITVMRSVATRMIIFLLQDIDIGKKTSESVTAAYLRRFVELSLFKAYLPFVTTLLGTEKFIKKDAFYPLRNLGVSNPVIDATLFAGMFSIGTLFIRCVGDIKRHGIDYSSLDIDKRRNFVIEAARLYPTVTTTHRIVESDEEVKVSGKTIKLTAGDEVIYPFACANTDTTEFKCPHKMDVERPKEEYDKVLSWSSGPHACPAKDLSILITMVMLDTLLEKESLESLDYKGALL